MNQLKLHFLAESSLEPCIKELKELQRPFTWERTHIDLRDILTKPEYLHIKAQATLTFASENDLRAFMQNSRAVNIYQKWANAQSQT